jgi:phosphoenolpyruvate synthase/pyruvate phosphate dikinase
LEARTPCSADKTDPDWEPTMKKAAAIVTNRGGRTCHAAIVSRELGLPAIVGVGDGTEVLSTGQVVTVSCAEGETGFVYDGTVNFDVDRVNIEIGSATHQDHDERRQPRSAWCSGSASVPSAPAGWGCGSCCPRARS